MNPPPVRSLTPGGWLVLALSVCVTAFLALGAHDLAITHLGIPYPDDAAAPAWARFLSQCVKLGGGVCLCRLASGRLDRQTAWGAAGLMGLLFVALHESLRVIVVGNVVTDGWIDLRWVHLLMGRAPNILIAFCTGASAAMIARTTRRPALTVALIVAVSAALYFGVQPLAKHAAGWVVASLQLAEPVEVHTPPYGFYVYKFIYGAFLEPTLGCLVLAALAWPGLRGSTLRRVGVFTLLVLLARGRVVATGLYSFWIDQPLLVAIAAEGQFFVETLIMATLTGLIWSSVQRMSKGRPQRSPAG